MPSVTAARGYFKACLQRKQQVPTRPRLQTKVPILTVSSSWVSHRPSHDSNRTLLPRRQRDAALRRDVDGEEQILARLVQIHRQRHRVIRLALVLCTHVHPVEARDRQHSAQVLAQADRATIPLGAFQNEVCARTVGQRLSGEKQECVST